MHAPGRCLLRAAGRARGDGAPAGGPVARGRGRWRAGWAPSASWWCPWRSWAGRGPRACSATAWTPSKARSSSPPPGRSGGTGPHVLRVHLWPALRPFVARRVPQPPARRHPRRVHRELLRHRPAWSPCPWAATWAPATRRSSTKGARASSFPRGLLLVLLVLGASLASQALASATAQGLSARKHRAAWVFRASAGGIPPVCGWVSLNANLLCPPERSHVPAHR